MSLSPCLVIEGFEGGSKGTLSIPATLVENRLIEPSRSVVAWPVMAEIREPGEVTELLGRWSLGEEEAGERLLAVVYGELRRLAAAALRCERPGASEDV